MCSVTRQSTWLAVPNAIKIVNKIESAGRTRLVGQHLWRELTECVSSQDTSSNWNNRRRDWKRETEVGHSQTGWVDWQMAGWQRLEIKRRPKDVTKRGAKCKTRMGIWMEGGREEGKEHPPLHFTPLLTKTLSVPLLHRCCPSRWVPPTRYMLKIPVSAVSGASN